MFARKEGLSPEMITAVKDVVPDILGISFSEMYQRYLEENDGRELKEEDLISEILEAGGYQAEDDAGFEDTVTIGLYAVGGPLGLI